MARRSSNTYQLESEEFEEVLERMLKEADQYIEFRECMDFFSRKGRPAQFYE